MQRLVRPKRQATVVSPESPDEFDDEASSWSGGGGVGGKESAAENTYGPVRPKTPDQNNEVTFYRLEPTQQYSLRNESCWGLLARTLLLTLGLLSVASAAAILTLLVLARRLNLYYSVECCVLVLQSIIGIYVALTRNKCLILFFAIVCMLNACAIAALLLYGGSPSEIDRTIDTATTTKGIAYNSQGQLQSTTIMPKNTSLAGENISTNDNIQIDPNLNAPSTSDHERVKANPNSSTTRAMGASSPQTTKLSTTTTVATPYDFEEEANEFNGDSIKFGPTQTVNRRAKLLDRLKSPYDTFRKSLHEDKDRRLVIVAYILWLAIVCDVLAAIIAVLLLNIVTTGDSHEPGLLSHSYARPNKTTNRKPSKSPMLLLVHKTLDRSNHDAYVEVLRPTVRTGRLDDALPYGAEPMATGSTGARKPGSRLGIDDANRRRKPGGSASPSKVRPAKVVKRKSQHREMSPKNETSPKRQVLANKEAKRKYLEPKRTQSPKPNSYTHQPVHKIADESSSVVANLKEVRDTPKMKSSTGVKSISSDHLVRALTRTGSLREDPTSAGF